MSAELAFGAHFAGDARYFRSEGIQLVHHRVDGVLEFENLALHVHGDLAREIATRHGRRYLGDISYLRRQVTRHGVHTVGQIFPCTRHARHICLSAQTSFRAHFARDARHLAGEAVQLVHHGVERFLQLKDLAAHVDGDLAREVAVRDGGRHLGDVAHLARQIARHRVDAVGQVFPGARNARNRGLSAELTIGTHLARDTRDFRGKRVQLIDHGVDRLFQLQDFAAHVHRDFFRKVALRHRRCDFGDVAHLRR